jgi:hypothetical protein
LRIEHTCEWNVAITISNSAREIEPVDAGAHCGAHFSRRTQLYTIQLHLPPLAHERGGVPRQLLLRNDVGALEGIRVRAEARSKVDKARHGGPFGIVLPSVKNERGLVEDGVTR